MKKPFTMMFSILTIFSAGFFSGCSKFPSKEVRQIPLEDFFRNPDQSSYQISPNGEYFSFTAPYERRMNIFVQKIGEESSIRLTSDTLRDIAGYLWAGNDRILYLKDTGGDENYKLFVVDADGSNLKGLTDFPNVRTTFIDPLIDIPDEVIIGLNQRNPTVFDPYRLNIVTGELTMLAENPGNIQDWMTDHDGKLRIATAIVDGVNQSLMYRDTEEDEFRDIITVSFKETLSPAFFTFDNKNVYAVSNLGRDKAALIEFDIANGKEIKMLYENPEYDISGAFYSEKRKVLTSASYTSWKRERHFFDDETKELFDFLYKELPGYELGITSMSRDEDKMIVRTYNDRSLGAHYFFNASSKELTKINEVSPWLKEEELSQMIPVSYMSRDGLKIHGYLTLPAGVSMKKAKKLPVVVNPHGGPWARDSWGFNPEIQFLANRGFAVFQMNFRGSTGYGKEFYEKSFKQWGLTMQDDITDGVNWLISEGIADKERIAIYGGSYGGYATLAGLTLTPELYAAGVDYVGVSNLFTFLNTIPPYWKPLLDIMYEMVGHPEKDSLQFAQTSPVFLADRIVAPLFIAQGANDPRVNKAESDQMVEALKARGVEVEYMVKDNEGHGFHNEENRFDFYRAMEAFLTRHIGMN
jgi:dipeptidyl aminopeptidase/acylaminoacyl peptidase